MGKKQTSIDEEQNEDSEHGTKGLSHKQLKTILKKSYVKDAATMAMWSCTYDEVTAVQRDAARRIQRCYRNWQSWKKASKRKEEIQNKGKSAADKLTWLWLFVFNCAGVVAGVGASAALYWYLISDREGGLGQNTEQNWTLFWLQLGYAFVCATGLYVASPGRLDGLRMYSYAMLLVCGALLATVGVFSLDSSEATQELQRKTYLTVANQACSIQAQALNALGTDAVVNETAVTAGSWKEVEKQLTEAEIAQQEAEKAANALKESFNKLCTCYSDCQSGAAETNSSAGNATVASAEADMKKELDGCRVACVESELVGDSKYYLAIFFILLLMIQMFTANRAWAYLHDAAPNEDGKQSKGLKKWLKERRLEEYLTRMMVLGVRDMESMLDMDLAKIREVGMRHEDMKRFVREQGEEKVNTLEQTDELGLSGWDKLDHGLHGEDLHDALATNVTILTKTWYYETSVLASVAMCMWVMSSQSPAYPPEAEQAVTYRTVEIFLTIFLSMEMLLELVTCCTSFRGVKAYFTNPWHLVDLFVLIVFWMYIMYPAFLVFVSELPQESQDWISAPPQAPAWISVMRVARVLRPLRTLRLLGDVSLVAQCVTNRLSLFRDAVILTCFMLTLFSMVGISCFAGALHYTCVKAEGYDVFDPAANATQRMIYDERQWQSKEDAWTNTSKLLPCPTTLKCAIDNKKQLLPHVQCVPRAEDLEVGEDGYGTRSFDNIWMAFYTMFILLSGDNGMQDIPNALYAVDAQDVWLSWPMFVLACFVLTYICLNLLLAICCTVFYDIHKSLQDTQEAREQAAAIRQKMLELDGTILNHAHHEAVAKGLTKAEIHKLEKQKKKERRKLAVPDVKHSPEAQLIANVAEDVKDELMEFATNPLGDIDADREEQARLLSEVQEGGGIRGHAANAVSSKFFGLIVLVLVLCYSVVIMAQETGQVDELLAAAIRVGDLVSSNSTEGSNNTAAIMELAGAGDASSLMLWVENTLVILFVVEFLLKSFGLGLGNYFSYGENRLDLLILLCTIIGNIGTHAASDLAEASQQAALACNGNVECLETNSRLDFSDEARYIMWFRILQMFRATYKYEGMRKILAVVFKSASSVVYLLVFVVFVLVLFALVGMISLGGGCNAEYMESIGMPLTTEEAEGCEYETANMETFETAFYTSFQIMTGEDWSEVMFWYIKFGPRRGYSAIFFMSMWLIVHGIVFSLFVAVLLLNFDMPEDEKMPHQKIAYDKHAGKKKRNKEASLKAAVAKEKHEATAGVVDESENVPLYERLIEEAEGFVVKSERTHAQRSLYIFFLDNPIRILCAKLEGHAVFETAVCLLIALSLGSLAIEGPACQKAALASMTGDLVDSTGNETLTNSSLVQEQAGLGGAVLASEPCTSEKYKFEFEMIGYSVLGIFVVELVLRSVSRGFLFRSTAACAPYLQNGTCCLDFFIIVVIVFCYTMENEGSKGWRLLRSMIPAMSLVRDRRVKKIVKSFQQSIVPCLTVAFPIVFMMCMWSIIGVDLFGSGQLKRCVNEDDVLSYLGDGDPTCIAAASCPAGASCAVSDSCTEGVRSHELFPGKTTLELNVTECTQLALVNGAVYADADPLAFPTGGGYKWANPPLDFDDAVSGLKTLLAAATAGVMPTQNVANEVAGPGQAPGSLDDDGVQNAYLTSTYYFSTFHLIFTFFLMNLFIGVMSYNFSESTGSLLVTDLQRRWIQFDNAILGKFAPHDSEYEALRPQPGTRMYEQRVIAFEIVTNHVFHDLFIWIIVANCLMLLSDSYPQDPEISELVETVDVWFVVVYTIEMVLKLFGFGARDYFRSGWNTFDFVLVMTALAAAVGGADTGLQSLRVLRAFRLFLLMAQMPGLTGLLDTVVHCLQPAATIGVLALITWYFYAIVGMQLFGDAGTDHDFYNENQNFLDFGSSICLLTQVCMGMNYMWLVQDLIAEGSDPNVLFLYFFSFFVLSVLILVNLFAIVVLDEFDAQNPVPQILGVQDLWAFTNAWAEETIGENACPSLVKRQKKLAKMLTDEDKKKAEKAEKARLKRLKKEEKQKKKKEKGDADAADVEDPELSVEVVEKKTVNQADETYIWSDDEHLHSEEEDQDEATATSPRAGAHSSSPRKGDTKDMKHRRGLKAKQEKKMRDSRRPTGVVSIELKMCSNLVLFKDNHAKPKKDRECPYIQVYPKKTGKSTPFHTPKYDVQKDLEINCDDGSVGGMNCDFNMPKRERSLVFEMVGYGGQKMGKGMLSVREIVETCEPDIPDNKKITLYGLRKPYSEATDEEIAFAEKIEAENAEYNKREGLSGMLSGITGGSHTPTKTARQKDGSFKPVLGSVHIDVWWKEGMALPKYTFMADFNDNAAYKEQGCGIEGWLWKRSNNTFASWERRFCWIEKDPVPALCYYKEVASEAEMEKLGRNGKLQVHTMPGHELQHVSGEVELDHKHLRHQDLLDCEFTIDRKERQSANGRHHRDASSYRFRALGEAGKNSWVAALQWLSEDGGGVCAGPRPERIPHAELVERDVQRVRNNPALLPLPFARVRSLLAHLSADTLNQSLVPPKISREDLIYYCYNLEMHALVNLSHLHEQQAHDHSLRSHVGEYLSELRGLDYTMTIRRLALLNYGKSVSLSYPDQVKEYRHDMHKVALNIISTAVSAWVMGKALPAYHERVRAGKVGKDAKTAKKLQEKQAKRDSSFPSSPIWRGTSAYRIAVYGCASLRLESLGLLLRAIKRTQPPLLAKAEREDAAEKIRRAEMSQEELEKEEAEKQAKAAEKAASGPSCWQMFLGKVGEDKKGDKEKDAATGSANGGQHGVKVVNPFFDDTEDDLAAAEPEPEGEDAELGMVVTAQGSDEQEDDDSTESGAKVINNPLDEATPRPVEDDSDSGSDTEGPDEQPYLDLFAVYDKSEPSGVLSQQETIKLLSGHYKVALGRSPKAYVRDTWETMCSDPTQGLSYQDWRIFDADMGGIQIAAKNKKTGGKRTKHKNWRSRPSRTPSL